MQGKAGARLVGVRGHVSPSDLRRGMGAGALAAAGLLAPGTRRVIVRARYIRQRAGDLGAARAHLRYIQRDGVTREGLPGHVYDASSDDADLEAFLDRSEGDPHQFRFVVSLLSSPYRTMPLCLHVGGRSNLYDNCVPISQSAQAAFFFFSQPLGRL